MNFYDFLASLFRLFKKPSTPPSAPVENVEESVIIEDSNPVLIRPDLLIKPIVQTITQAAALIGVSRATLVAMAGVESNFNPNAKAPTSSASGLFQFINSTWAAMVTKYGDKYEIGLNDRFDPYKSSIMGALFLKENVDYLESRLNRKIGMGESYLAHFLGAGGAVKMLSADPSAKARDYVSAAVVSANKTIFIKNGIPLSIATVTNNFNRKLRKVIE